MGQIGPSSPSHQICQIGGPDPTRSDEIGADRTRSARSIKLDRSEYIRLIGPDRTDRTRPDGCRSDSADKIGWIGLIQIGQVGGRDGIRPDRTDRIDQTRSGRSDPSETRWSRLADRPDRTHRGSGADRTWLACVCWNTCGIVTLETLFCMLDL